tara:strand:+ start:39748 stop:40008 length:261 start_codon:yes stop_codon:yes gene_type:complete
MRVKDYSTLKSASKVSFAKATVNDEEVIQLTEKRFDASTGSALADKVREVSLLEYESEQSQLNSEKARIEADLTELAKIITDIKAL